MEGDARIALRDGRPGDPFRRARRQQDTARKCGAASQAASKRGGGHRQSGFGKGNGEL
jgi:hypothetical protein